MNIRSKTVLITGAKGFTGVHLSAALKEEGAVVWGLCNELNESEEGNMLSADLRDYERVSEVLRLVRPDYIIHLAGISFAAHDNALPYYNVNVIGTQNLLDACVNVGLALEKVIIASSAAVYGDPKAAVTTESHRLNPQGHYGCSKLSMEFIAQSYMPKLPIVITRPFNYTGVGQAEHFLVPKIVKHFKDAKETIELGNTDIVREFSDVRDVSAVYIKLLTQAETGIVNLCSGIDCSFEHLITTLKKLTGHDIKIEINPAFIRSNDITKLVGDPAKLMQMTDTHYKYRLEDTLKWMLHS